MGFSDDVEGLLYARDSFFKLALAGADLPDHHEDFLETKMGKLGHMMTEVHFKPDA